MDAIEWARWVRERSGDRERGAFHELEAELAMERATTLGRLGLRLDAAVELLSELRRQAALGADRTALIEADRAGLAALRELRWEYTVVKEAMGLRGIRQDLDTHWPMPRSLECEAGAAYREDRV